MNPGDLCHLLPKVNSKKDCVGRQVGMLVLAGASSRRVSRRQTFSLLDGQSCCISPVWGEDGGDQDPAPPNSPGKEQNQHEGQVQPGSTSLFSSKFILFDLLRAKAGKHFLIAEK